MLIFFLCIIIGINVFYKSNFSRTLYSSCDLLEADRSTDDVINNVFCFFYDTKQINSMLPRVCSVIDHRRRQNVARTSVTHSAIVSCATSFLFLPHFDVICDLLTDARQHGIYWVNIHSESNYVFDSYAMKLTTASETG